MAGPSREPMSDCRRRPSCGAPFIQLQDQSTAVRPLGETAQRHPESVLWLISNTAVAELNLRREAARRGIEPERLIFAKREPYPQHLARIALADLCLDTWPFNGGATTSDALWSGVPVVTRSGRAFASRMSGSLLRSLGLAELVPAISRTTNISRCRSRLIPAPWCRFEHA